MWCFYKLPCSPTARKPCGPILYLRLYDKDKETTDKERSSDASKTKTNTERI